MELPKYFRCIAWLCYQFLFTHSFFVSLPLSLTYFSLLFSSLFSLFFTFRVIFPIFALNSRKICALSELNFITRWKIYVKKNICLWFFASFLVPFLVNDAIFHWINGVDLIRLPFRMQSTNFLPMAFKCMVHLHLAHFLPLFLLPLHSSTLDCCILFYNSCFYW